MTTSSHVFSSISRGSTQLESSSWGRTTGHPRRQHRKAPHRRRRATVMCVFMTAGPVFFNAVPITKLFACGKGYSGGHLLRETTSRGLCGLVCPSHTGTREEPGTLTQGGALFSLILLVWESNPKLQGGWCKPNHQPNGDLEPTQGGAGPITKLFLWGEEDMCLGPAKHGVVRAGPIRSTMEAGVDVVPTTD